MPCRKSSCRALSFRVHLGSVFYDDSEHIPWEVKHPVKYIVADPDQETKDQLVSLLEKHKELDYRGNLSPPELVRNRINQNPPDLAFIRMGHPELNALRVARFLREINPAVKVIFFGRLRTDAVEAYEYEGCGFLMIPFEEEKIACLLQLGSVNRSKYNQRKFDREQVKTDRRTNI